jgi:hypothetical protein
VSISHEPAMYIVIRPAAVWPGLTQAGPAHGTKLGSLPVGSTIKGLELSLNDQGDRARIIGRS